MMVMNRRHLICLPVCIGRTYSGALGRIASRSANGKPWRNDLGLPAAACDVRVSKRALDEAEGRQRSTPKGFASRRPTGEKAGGRKTIAGQALRLPPIDLDL